MQPTKTMNHTCAHLYLKVILDKDLHPCSQPPPPEENCQISKGRSHSISGENKANRMLGICDETCAEDGSTYDTAWEDKHPYPLPDIPVYNEEKVEEEREQAEDPTYSQFDELWDYPQPEWPECKKECRFKINLNPLQLRRKTICCLLLMSLVVALLICTTLTILVLMQQIKRGNIPN